MKKYAIIVAGGKGLRMGTDLPKQFLPLGGKPILMRTLEAFANCDNDIHIILVLPKEQQEYWKNLCKEYKFAIEHTIADGGETRFHSVKNGLNKVDASSKSLIAVHDGVRPFVSAETIKATYDTAEQKGTAVPVVPSVDSVRQTNGDENFALDRSSIQLVQTPQTFCSAILFEAYQQDFTKLFTDDASVVEKAGHKIILCEGNRENIKITTPFDMAVGNAILNKE